MDKYLARCLESILIHSINKEIICINDGSTDTSGEILETFAKQYPFIKVIHQENKGVSAARNLGIQLASGEYVMFIDPDDILGKNLDFPYILSVMEEENAPIAKGICIITYTNGQQFLFDPVNPEVKEDKMVKTASSIDFANYSVPNNWLILTGSFILNRNFIEKHQLKYREDLQLSEDVIFALDFLTTDEPVIELPYIFYHYLKREKSLSSKPMTQDKHKQFTKIFSIFEKYVEKFPAIYPYIKRLIEVHQITYQNECLNN